MYFCQNTVHPPYYLSLCLLLFLFVVKNSYAQGLERYMPVLKQGDELLDQAFIGGMNSPQFNHIDLNRDGADDLLIFDRAGKVLLPYLNKQESGTDNWQFAPEYIQYFPPIDNWILLRDYNMDGIPDLFTYSDVPGVDGIIPYKGRVEDDHITFDRINFDEFFNLLYFALPSGGRTPLRVSKIDYPAFDDMDCDGDLDILTFNVSGGQIELFTNESIERGFGTDTLIFRLTDFCWGGMFESGFTKSIDLAPSMGDCATTTGITIRHAGSTILTLDRDNDGDKDVILGDLSFENLNFLTNDGSCDTAWLSKQELDFPSNNVPITIESFPAAFQIDVDNDGLLDLVAAPNAARNAENLEVAWWYKNTNTNEEPTFEFQQTDFLVDKTLDLGGFSHPAVADIDGDGLLDLLIGNGGIIDSLNLINSELFYYRNVGTANEPVFELVDDNFLDLRRFNPDFFNFTPAFGDLDGDLDLDLIVGEQTGQLFYAENLAGPNQPMMFANWEFPYQNIDVGLASTPQIFDLNEDGKNDLLIGELNGNVNYLPNQGEDEPLFTADPDVVPNNFFLGELDARIPGFVIGSSAPHFFYDGENKNVLLGTETGQLELYQNVDVESSYSISDDQFGRINEGLRTNPITADIDNDGLLELIVGNERGGISFYQTEFILGRTTSTEDFLSENDITLFPNPANETLFIRTDRNIREMMLYDALGRLVNQYAGDVRQIDLQALVEGIYLLQMKVEQNVLSKKFSVLRR
ncbi:MAG: FG-GAP-like repeat-containing protein [Bacteroidota bacterium]